MFLKKEPYMTVAGKKSFLDTFLLGLKNTQDARVKRTFSAQEEFDFCLDWITSRNGKNALDAQIIVFALDEKGLCRSDNDFMDSDGHRHGDGVYSYAGAVNVVLSELESHVQKLVFAVATTSTSVSLSEILLLHLSLAQQEEQEHLASFLSEDMDEGKVFRVAMLTRSGANWTLDVEGRNLSGTLEEVRRQHGLE